MGVFLHCCIGITKYLFHHGYPPPQLLISLLVDLFGRQAVLNTISSLSGLGLALCFAQPYIITLSFTPHILLCIWNPWLDFLYWVTKKPNKKNNKKKTKQKTELRLGESVITSAICSSHPSKECSHIRKRQNTYTHVHSFAYLLFLQAFVGGKKTRCFILWFTVIFVSVCPPAADRSFCFELLLLASFAVLLTNLTLIFAMDWLSAIYNIQNTNMHINKHCLTTKRSPLPSILLQYYISGRNWRLFWANPHLGYLVTQNFFCPWQTQNSPMVMITPK